MASAAWQVHPANTCSTPSTRITRPNGLPAALLTTACPTPLTNAANGLLPQMPSTMTVITNVVTVITSRRGLTCSSARRLRYSVGTEPNAAANCPALTYTPPLTRHTSVKRCSRWERHNSGAADHTKSGAALGADREAVQQC